MPCPAGDAGLRVEAPAEPRLGREPEQQRRHHAAQHPGRQAAAAGALMDPRRSLRICMPLSSALLGLSLLVLPASLTHRTQKNEPNDAAALQARDPSSKHVRLGRGARRPRLSCQLLRGRHWKRAGVVGRRLLVVVHPLPARVCATGAPQIDIVCVAGADRAHLPPAPRTCDRSIWACAPWRFRPAPRNSPPRTDLRRSLGLCARPHAPLISRWRSSP